jgi:hypothetical protein
MWQMNVVNLPEYDFLCFWNQLNVAEGSYSEEAVLG